MPIAPRTPAAAARFVVRAMSAMSGTAAIVDPGLKPHQPIQSIRTPRTASGMLWPGMVTGRPSSSYLPSRGPRSRVPARAAAAPDPVPHHRVDKTRKDDGEDHVHREPGPLEHRAPHDR